MDIVYLWCDGNDPKWRKKRNDTFNAILDKQYLTSYANVEGRFRDNGELLYSLRSIELYFPNHGNIYIVSDSQIPSYLKKSEKVKYLFHQDILPYTPTFSSKSIEASIPFIPEISEDFLFLNDDVFLGPKFSLESFIRNGIYQYYFFPSEVQSVDELIHQSVMASSLLGDDELNGMQSAHTPKIISKSRYLEMAKKFLPYLKNTQHEKFRDERNLSLLSDFFPRWMCSKGYGKSHILKEDVSVGSRDKQYNKITYHFHDLPFFGMNDTSDNEANNHPDLLMLKDTLQALFPEKSSFEI